MQTVVKWLGWLTKESNKPICERVRLGLTWPKTLLEDTVMFFFSARSAGMKMMKFSGLVFVLSFFFGAVATHYFAVEEPTFVMAFKCINIFLLAFLNGKRYIRWCCCHGIISKALIQVRSLSQRSPVRWKRLGSCGWWNVMIIFAVTEVSGA